MSNIDEQSATQPGAASRKPRQFGLKALFAVTAFVGAECAIIRLFGASVVPLCVQTSVCVFLVAWTHGRIVKGLIYGSVWSAALGALILGQAWKWPLDYLIVMLTISTLGGWLGAAVHGIVNGYLSGVCALVLVILWMAPVFLIYL